MFIDPITKQISCGTGKQSSITKALLWEFNTSFQSSSQLNTHVRYQFTHQFVNQRFRLRNGQCFQQKCPQPNRDKMFFWLGLCVIRHSWTVLINQPITAGYTRLHPRCSQWQLFMTMRMNINAPMYTDTDKILDWEPRRYRLAHVSGHKSRFYRVTISCCSK